jgi:hypothetical protein
MSTLESKIGDFLFDISCEFGLKGNDLLQQCITILQQKMSKIKPTDLHHPVPVPAQSLSIEIPSSTRATPGSRAGFSPYPTSAFSSRSTIIRAASKESCCGMQDEEETEEQLNTSMDSEDVNLIDGLSDATVCSNLTNDLAEQIEAENGTAANSSASSSEKPKRKRAPKQVDPLKAAMKARKEELLKEKQAQRLAKIMEKEALALAKAAEKAKEKEKLKKTNELATAAASEETDGEPKRKPKRKVAETSSSSSAAVATSSSSENVEPEKKKKRTRKALDTQAAAANAVVVDDDDMFGNREEVLEDLRVENHDMEEGDAEIQGFVDEDEGEEDDDDGVSIDGGEVEDVWQKKVIDGKSYTISSMTNKVYNSSLFVVGERNQETGDIRFYSSSPQPAPFEMKA